MAASSSNSTETGNDDVISNNEDNHKEGELQTSDKASSQCNNSDNDVNVEELLPELRKELGSQVADGVTDHNLLKFLRWKPCVNRASERFRAHIAWREENPFVFDDTNKPLLISQNDELKRLLESNVVIAPEDAIANDGSAVCMVRLRFNDMKDGRTTQGVVQMGLYTMDRLLERSEAQTHGITIIHDLRDVTRENVDISIPKIMFGAIMGHFPLHIKAIYILEAPWFMKAMFKLLRTLGAFTKKVMDRTHFVNSVEEVYEVVNRDLLLEEHGGKMIYDQSEWVLKQMERERNNTMESLHNCMAGKLSS